MKEHQVFSESLSWLFYVIVKGYMFLCVREKMDTKHVVNSPSLDSRLPLTSWWAMLAGWLRACVWAPSCHYAMSSTDSLLGHVLVSKSCTWETEASNC